MDMDLARHESNRIPIPAADASDRDWLVRIEQTESTTIVTASLTKTIVQPISNLIDENNILRGVVRNLWQLYKYHQEYESFILGGCSEAEFLAVAEQYATIFQNMLVQNLTFAASLLLNILDVPLTSSDLSVLLNVDPFNIEQTLNSSSDIHAVPLAHRDSHGEQR